MSKAVLVYRCRYCDRFFDGEPDAEEVVLRRYVQFVEGNIRRNIHWSIASHECFDHINGIGDLIAIKMLETNSKSTEEKASDVDN